MLPPIEIEEILDSEARPPLRPLRSIGRSREGRDILGAVLGSGPRHVSLIGGCHPDEPVGPAMLLRLVSYLSSRPDTRYTWYIVPHVNPDGEARNAAWSEPGLQAEVFDLGLFLRHAVREKPGDDMEFGFPDGRPENQAVAGFLAGGAPFVLHGSFHSNAFAPGPWFLIEPAWIDRTAELRRSLRERVRALGYGLFDVDRRGEKGFRRIDEGFSTRPDSRSMIAWFEERGDPVTAARFRPSSMEYVRSLGGDPFTFVSEMPLFLRPLPEGDTGRPDDPIFRAWLEQVALSGGDIGDDQVRGMPIRDQMRLQLAFLDEALACISPHF